MKSKESRRIVYFEGRMKGWRMHTLYNDLLDYPPEGYRFVLDHVASSTKSKGIHKVNSLMKKFDSLGDFADYVLPLGYLAYSKLTHGQQPENTVLTYASQHVIFRKEKWVVDLEQVEALVAYGRIDLCKSIIEKVLRSPYCKRIIPWSEAGKKTLFLNLDCRGFADKIEVVPLAVSPKNFKKRFDNSKVKLLFVGTGNPWNVPGSFYLKGGVEAIKTFIQLKKKYPFIELTIRSYVPTSFMKVCKKIRGIRVIEKRVPWPFIEKEFKTADVFLYPSHSTPGKAILDAMSYELPVITLDVWGTSEMVRDGVTGFLVRKSQKVPYYVPHFIPHYTSRFMKGIKHADNRVVEELVEKTSILIEDESLRHRMGKRGREEIESGRFSILRRNKRLKQIFADAIEP